jgi:hypothetical protein
MTPSEQDEEFLEAISELSEEKKSIVIAYLKNSKTDRKVKG